MKATNDRSWRMDGLQTSTLYTHGDTVDQIFAEAVTLTNLAV